jgi:hypothetical protein
VNPAPAIYLGKAWHIFSKRKFYGFSETESRFFAEDVRRDSATLALSPRGILCYKAPLHFRVYLLAHTIRMSIQANVSPESPVEEQPTIGLIGMGAMGTMYAKHLTDAGWKKRALLFMSPCVKLNPHFGRIYVCDLPSKYEALKATYQGEALQ